MNNINQVAKTLHACFEAAEKAMEKSPQKSEKKLIEFLKLKYQNVEHEVFGLVILDHNSSATCNA